MAIKAIAPITTREGHEIDGLYIRVDCKECICGKKLDIRLKHYASKQAFLLGATTVKTDISIFGEHIEYNRIEDGADILLLCHNRAIGFLTSSQGIDPLTETPLPPVYTPEQVTIEGIE